MSGKPIFSKLFIMLMLVLVVLSACGSTANETATQATVTPLAEEDPTTTPATAAAAQAPAGVTTVPAVVVNMPTATPIIPDNAPGSSAGGTPITAEGEATSLAEFETLLMEAIRDRNYDLLRLTMDESFGIASWRGEGRPWPTVEAVDWLREYYLLPTSIITFPTPQPDPNTLLGMDPLGIWGNDANLVRAVYSQGWGPDGQGEAILVIAQTSEGVFYWYSILAAPLGFASTPIPGEDQDTSATYEMLEYAEQIRKPLTILNDTAQLMGIIRTNLETGVYDNWQEDARFVRQEMDRVGQLSPTTVSATVEVVHGDFMNASMGCDWAASGFGVAAENGDPTPILDPQVEMYLNGCREALDIYNARMQMYLFPGEG